MKVLMIVGTRPEAIKMIPVYRTLSAREDMTACLLLTGQHREMARSVLDLFGVNADIDLDLMEHGQTLLSLSARLTAGLSRVIVDEQPDVILVQGDTTSAMIGGMLGFYAGCRVGHIEAGLRTGNLASPFPEEFNRRVITLGAHWHFAPTAAAAENLRSEGITLNVHTVGNTVIDAALDMADQMTPGKAAMFDQLPFLDDSSGKSVLVTVHRRENIGTRMAGIAAAVGELATLHSSTHFVVPVHPNPAVGAVVRPILESLENVHLIAPLYYDQMIYMLSRAFLVLTDSGGIQEEAPSFNVPVLVLRNESERMEGVDAGCSRLVGTEPSCIVKEAQTLLSDPVAHAMMANSANPYGDGCASQKIAQILSGIE
ncbi:UDP-N-acetylglucosamine 2-epimerase (non-hydrolyzing) [Marinobacter adhaerens]|uniref:UDP-N-acetylglucosamine 2-epimerase (non-hydrolyzing) n=1 Tax=Marinobacter adhaerens (strain DSM 23420 / HP15) TaxID=225937 RepID=E4PS17_MARAH|nr:UDP-N-acetylglucosamine 2-epimerase (non-hydrolyzing) [Marinobacter adhaerens]ADQ00052.1 UDP-N-acetylglucosamine 2-epimerase [Marinobacter adhaerens HP15]MBW4980241.1 UDP-N-acetylglucosamine 2-epimerase (non-hydrolyzing) [Marinobacter adhaerens]